MSARPQQPRKPWFHAPSGFWCAQVAGKRHYLDHDRRGRQPSTIRTIAGTNLLALEAMRRRLAELKAELAGPKPTAPQACAASWFVSPQRLTFL